MDHIPDLITDLALILAAAAITSLIFKKIKQPQVLGYILAGFLVGPHFSLVPSVSDEANIKIWAEIGVIFLLFSLGLEFSFKKLVKVGGAATITALVEVAFMFCIGIVTGKLMGWNTMDSIFLGGILSISSTTIIIRAFEESGLKSQGFVNLVFGILIVEDLVAILLLVLLSTFGVSQSFSGSELLLSLARLSFFLILWFLAGIFLIPSFLRITRQLMNDENMLIFSIGMCLLMVIFATKAGFSPALGAFIMGSILAETRQAERIEHLVLNVKNLFAAIFFVSIGMLINPDILAEFAGPILIISLITVAGKMLSTSAGALISGQSLRYSIQAGFSVSQIGEFSFIIASLGMSLNVTSPFLYPVAVAVSAITTFTTPYLIQSSEKAFHALESFLPSSWISKINSYSSTTQVIGTSSDWKIYLHSYLKIVVALSVIIIAIILISVNYLYPAIHSYSLSYNSARAATIALTGLIMSPFLWVLSFRKIEQEAFSHIYVNKKFSRGPLIILELTRMILGLAFLLFFLSRFSQKFSVLLFILCTLTLILFIFSRNLQIVYSLIEKRFIINLNEREEKSKLKHELAPWDAHLVPFTLEPESSLTGKTLQELAVRENFGVNIALIERGSHTIAAPGRDVVLFPGDRIYVIGSDEQLLTFRALVETRPAIADNQEEKEQLTLEKFEMTVNLFLNGRSIKESGLRETARALVVGIERDGKRILNPDSGMSFKEGDIVWIVGNKSRIREFLKV
jgi:monovalent cation:H+ antiporter-2, CPA2 family